MNFVAICVAKDGESAVTSQLKFPAIVRSMRLNSTCEPLERLVWNIKDLHCYLLSIDRDFNLKVVGDAIELKNNIQTISIGSMVSCYLQH